MSLKALEWLTAVWPGVLASLRERFGALAEREEHLAEAVGILMAEIAVGDVVADGTKSEN